MLRKLAAVALCVASLVCAADKAIAARHLVESSRRHIVTHGENGFKVNNQEVDLYLDSSLKGISKAKLAKLLASNRTQLHVRTIEDQYGLDLKHQLKGGGPIFAGWAYWITKSACYGVVGGAIGAGAGAAVALAGPVAPVVAAATSGLGAGTVTTAAGVTCATTLTGAGAVAAGVAASPVLAEAAVVVTTSAVSSGMGLGAFVAFTESAALAASAFVLALPTP
ncbi:hypothetical protein JST99_02075 [Candidatus Dependentiae bacterium]|nr:hypothetical protein [Candidatus Dependentiae bacterium]